MYSYYWISHPLWQTRNGTRNHQNNRDWRIANIMSNWTREERTKKECMLLENKHGATNITSFFESRVKCSSKQRQLNHKNRDTRNRNENSTRTANAREWAEPYNTQYKIIIFQSKITQLLSTRQCLCVCFHLLCRYDDRNNRAFQYSSVVFDALDAFFRLESCCWFRYFSCVGKITIAFFFGL